jgi:hypothetical protein
MSVARPKLDFRKATYVELFNFLDAPDRSIVSDEDLKDIQKRISRLERADTPIDSEKLKLDEYIKHIVTERKVVTRYLENCKKPDSKVLTAGNSAFDLIPAEIQIDILENLSLYERFDLCTVSKSFYDDILNSKIKSPYLYQPTLEVVFRTIRLEEIPHWISLRAFRAGLASVSMEQMESIKQEISKLDHINPSIAYALFEMITLCGKKWLPLNLTLLASSFAVGCTALTISLASYRITLSEVEYYLHASLYAYSTLAAIAGIWGVKSDMNKRKKTVNWTAKLFSPQQEESHQETKQEKSESGLRRRFANHSSSQ